MFRFYFELLYIVLYYIAEIISIDKSTEFSSIFIRVLGDRIANFFFPVKGFLENGVQVCVLNRLSECSNVKEYQARSQRGGHGGHDPLQTILLSGKI